MAVRVAIIGCGDIAHAYTALAPLYSSFAIVACASRNRQSAETFAAQYELVALDLEEAISGAYGVEAILNLTPPASHFDISMAALKNGLHVYSEKPLASTLAQGRMLAEHAAANGLRLGGAPDTFLGASLQLSRRLIDGGRIGNVTFGHANFVSGGMEHRHPNPEFFFKPGGGPALDAGPYYVTALISLLGPIISVSASGTIGRPHRRVTAPGSPKNGSFITAEVYTTIQAQLRFARGMTVAMTLSWDGWETSLPHLELHGTNGRLILPDPDFFGGKLEIFDGTSNEWLDTEGWQLGKANWPYNGIPQVANYRGIGMADFAQSMVDNRPHRASAELCLHVLDALEAVSLSANNNATVNLTTSCDRPEVLRDDELRKLMAKETTTA